MKVRTQKPKESSGLTDFRHAVQKQKIRRKHLKIFAEHFHFVQNSGALLGSNSPTTRESNHEYLIFKIHLLTVLQVAHFCVN